MGLFLESGKIFTDLRDHYIDLENTALMFSAHNLHGSKHSPSGRLDFQAVDL